MLDLSLPDIDLVIFDCDGVLVDSEPISNAVLAEHATRMGWTMDGPTAQSHFKGSTMEQVHARIVAEVGPRDAGWIDGYYKDCDVAFVERLEPVPGAVELVGRVLASGRKACVASQGTMAKMRVTLGKVGLWDVMEGHIHSATEVAQPKPFPDLFLHAAEQSGVAPDRACIIEDSLTGVRAAQAAEIAVFYLSPDGDGAEEAERLGARTITSLSQVLSD